MRVVWIALPLLLCAVSCAPRLGDDCETNVDCSVKQDRACDTTQPGGYCTIANCTAGACGDEGLCVRFRPDEPRLSADWCMAKCDQTGDCDRDRYVCRSAHDLNCVEGDGPDCDKADRVAEVLESDGTRKFCVVKE